MGKFPAVAEGMQDVPHTCFQQVTFVACAPLDAREECAVSLTGETRKLTVVGNIPELGAWSLTKGITLRQFKNGVSRSRACTEDLQGNR